ncbi:MAG: hypothetical protein ACTHN3_12760 [Solirubrobacterales bacterium]
MPPSLLRETFTRKNAFSNGVWTVVYALIYAAISAAFPVVLHATTSLNGIWLGLMGFALFCFLCAATLTVWTYLRARSTSAAAETLPSPPGSPGDQRHDGTEALLPRPIRGDLAQRLDALLAATSQFANILENFDNWQAAVENNEYEDRLPDGTSTVTHAEAMQTLHYAFAQFFSAAWIYEDHCSEDWHRSGDLKEAVGKVYKAFGDRPIGPVDDETIMSGQLHTLGELSSERWRSAEAKPLGPADFEAKAGKDPQLAAALKPLERFLLAAEPNTEAHARVEAAKNAVKGVRDWLDNHHRP